jgi:hypothetical protein
MMTVCHKIVCAVLSLAQPARHHMSCKIIATSVAAPALDLVVSVIHQSREFVLQLRSTAEQLSGLLGQMYCNASFEHSNPSLF